NDSTSNAESAAVESNVGVLLRLRYSTTLPIEPPSTRLSHAYKDSATSEQRTSGKTGSQDLSDAHRICFLETRCVLISSIVISPKGTKKKTEPATHIIAPAAA